MAYMHLSPCDIIITKVFIQTNHSYCQEKAPDYCRTGWISIVGTIIKYFQLWRDVVLALNKLCMPAFDCFEKHAGEFHTSECV